MKKLIKQLLPYILTIFLICMERHYGEFTKFWPLILVDALLMLLMFLLYKKYPRYPLPLITACVILFFYGWAMNRQQDNMLSQEEYSSVRDSGLSEMVEKVLDEDFSFYRMDTVGNGIENQRNLNRIFDSRQNITSLYSSAYNDEYQRFRKDIFRLNEPFRNNMMQSPTDNPVFLQLMGVKYLAAEHAPDGYELVEQGENFNIYKNEKAAPILYATDQAIGEKEYRNYDFPENQTAFLKKVVVPDSALMPESGKDDGDKQAEENVTHMSPCDLQIPLINTEDIIIEKDGEGYAIEAKKETAWKVSVSGMGEENDLLAVGFDVENEKPNKDMYIRMEGQTNRLSAENHEYANNNTDFTFMVTLQKTEKEEDALHAGRTVEMKFGKGKYHIKNLRAFAGNMSELSNTKLYGNAVKIDREKSNGDQLAGSVTADKSGFLVTSIPYDENFTVTVDGEKTEIIKVNTSFLGAPITAGKHEIVISYQAPGKMMGMAVSLFGLVLLCRLSVCRNQNSRQKRSNR